MDVKHWILGQWHSRHLALIYFPRNTSARYRLSVAQWESAYIAHSRPWVQSPAPQLRKEFGRDPFSTQNLVPPAHTEYSHVKVIVPRVVGMQDKLLHFVCVCIKEDVLTKKTRCPRTKSYQGRSGALPKTFQLGIFNHENASSFFLHIPSSLS